MFRALFHREEPPTAAPAAADAPPTNEFVPAILDHVVIEDWDGSDPHDRFFHPVN
jgi:hypothetical protein